jgi:hypothetical protein
MTLLGRHQDLESVPGRTRVVTRDGPTNERKPRLPNFLIIGAMKSGTSSLYHYLRSHPQVFMPRIKELNFFQQDSKWRRGVGWYAKQFRNAGPNALAVGEASPGYTRYPHFPGVPERIAAHLPDVRLIYVVRDPIERIRSHYQHSVIGERETNPVSRAVLENPVYLDVSRYAYQIEQYLPHVSRDRLLVITSESLRSDRLATIRQVYDFLEVEPEFVPPVLDQEFFPTQGRPVYPRTLWALRGAARWIPGAKRAREFVYRTGILRRQHVSRDSDPGRSDGREELTIPEHVRRVLERELRDDVTRLREYLPPGFDGWGIG